jgi:hypothetical protein
MTAGMDLEPLRNQDHANLHEETKMEQSTPHERTLDRTISHLHRRGFTGHFGVVADELREFRTGLVFRAEELRVCGRFQFEGGSDPSDMAVVYAIESRTGVRGTLVDACGVYASPAITGFMGRVATAGAGTLPDRVRAA